MKNTTRILLLIILFVVEIASAQYTDVINSNRPGKSMMAFSVGKSIVQLESGIFGIKENHDLIGYDANGFGFDFTLRWGLFKEELELVAELQYQKDKYTSPIEQYNRSGLRTSIFGAKYLLYDPNKYYEQEINIRSWKANQGFKWRQLIPAVGVFGGININFSDNPFSYNSTIIEPKISPKFALITQNTFSTRWVLVTNLIYNKFTNDFKSLEYIATLTHGINQKWSVFVENQGFSGDYYKDIVFRGGGAYLVTPTLQFDASFSKNIKNTPSIMYGGFGVSWRFENNYKGVKILSPKDREKDKANKSDKGKGPKLNKNKEKKLKKPKEIE
jgi:hypothetical protein